MVGGIFCVCAIKQRLPSQAFLEIGNGVIILHPLEFVNGFSLKIRKAGGTPSGDTSRLRTCYRPAVVFCSNSAEPLWVLMIYRGRPLTSSYILAMYKPMMLRLIMIALPINSKSRITVEKPVSALWLKYIYRVCTAITTAAIPINMPSQKTINNGAEV